MGIYFNPGNESFRECIISDIYIDKTMLIKEMNHILGKSNKCVALSHARRFGKSQAARMLRAYYSVGCDSKEMFSGFKIAKDESFDEHLNKYNVIHLDIASIVDNLKDELVVKIENAVKKEMEKDYPDNVDYSANLAAVCNEIYNISGRKFIVIIDEWDCVIRNYSDKKQMVHSYMQFLHSLFKSEESASFLALGYITGILPIKKIEDESALNNFKEYTMVNSGRFTKYYGFTEDEVKNLCIEYGMDFDTVKNWYNGYEISGEHMYNPYSVYNCMLDNSIESYWKNTSAFGTINKFIHMNYEGLKDDIIAILEGKRVRVKVDLFKNDLSEIASKDDCLTALIHLGYLGYDANLKKAYLPNYEVATAFESALIDGKWRDVAKAVADCDALLDATIEMDEVSVAKYIEYAHDTYTSALAYNQESSLNTTILMAYFTARAYYEIVPEFPSGKGFVDFAFIPRSNAGSRPAMIVELKWDKSADTALKQIEEKRYTGRLANFSDKVLLVGINYDKDSKKHECMIKKM